MEKVINKIADDDGILKIALGRWVKTPDQELNYFDKLKVKYDINGATQTHPVKKSDVP